jgi:hypothetical protein
MAPLALAMAAAVAVALVALMFSWMVGRHAEAKPLGGRQPKVQVIEASIRRFPSFSGSRHAGSAPP